MCICTCTIKDSSAGVRNVLNKCDSGERVFFFLVHEQLQKNVKAETFNHRTSFAGREVICFPLNKASLTPRIEYAGSALVATFQENIPSDISKLQSLCRNTAKPPSQAQSLSRVSYHIFTAKLFFTSP